MKSKINRIQVDNMRAFKQLVIFFITIEVGMVSCSGQSFQNKIQKKDKIYERNYASLSAKVDMERIRKGVYYLSKDPLPRRVLNYSLPGHLLSTLEEADAWLIQQLKNYGYKPETDETKVHAFSRDFSKPLSQQYSKPADDAPWYIARNIIADRRGKKYPDDLIIIIAHKDSQSWIASPGANDDAIGTCGALELTILLRDYKPDHTIRFIFCNEEHTPWTSITAAKNIKTAGLNVLALINVDGIGVKSPQPAGIYKNVTRYTTAEGERLADMMARLNEHHGIGLVQSKLRSERPGDDDGSFINAGFPWSVRNCGSIPNGHPYYHTEGDTPETVDYENAALTVKLTLAAIIHLDTFGRP
jgi:hypothetical protein